MTHIDHSTIDQKNKSGDNIIADTIYYKYIINGVEKEIPKFLTLEPFNQSFIGREAEIQELETALQAHNTVLILQGLGGIGKSSLAKEYLRLHRNDYQYIAWIEQTTSLSNAFLLDGLLQRSLGLQFTNEEEIYKFKTILHALAKLSGDNLLVIDNYTEVTEDKSLNPLGFLPFAEHWKILITSRAQISRFQRIPLDVLPEAQAITLFKKHCPDKTIDEAALKTILQIIGYHTLTIELLSKTYHKSLRLKNLTELREYLENNALDHEKLQIEIFTEHSKQEVQLYTYLLQIFKMEQFEEHELHLLKNLAVLPPQAIAAEKILEWLGSDEAQNEKTLLKLADKGWISQQKGQTFEMHRLIQSLVVKTQAPTYADCAHLFEHIIQLLDYQENQVKAIEKLEVVDYGEHLLQKLGFDQAMDKRSLLQNELASTYQVFGQYQKARDLLHKALEADLKNFDEDHPNVARNRANLAVVYKNLGEYVQARDLLLKALEADLKNLDENHSIVARNRSNLATVYQALGEYAQAKDLLLQALESDLKNFGEDHPSVAIKRSNLALVYQVLGEYAQARDLLLQALEASLRNFEEDHPQVAKYRSNLANVYQDLGEYAQAKDLLLQALEANVKNFGENHLAIAYSKNNLAWVFFKLKDYIQAKALFESAYQICLQNLGENHPHTRQVKESLEIVENSNL